MIKNRRFVLAVMLAVVVLLVPFLGLRPALMALGRHELYIFARDKNYCGSESCEDGIAHVMALLHEKSGLPVAAVPWCMAANRIYFADFSFANAIMNRFAGWMYRSCENDTLTLDNANITLGESDGD